MAFYPCIQTRHEQASSSIDDPQPSIPHDEVMAEMDADIAALPKKKHA
jgi:hypothetical protein